MYRSFKVRNHESDGVEQFRYSCWTTTNEIEREVATRTLPENKCFHGLAKLPRVSVERTKNTIVTPLRPVIINGAETRPLRKTEKRELIMLGRRTIPEIICPIKHRGNRVNGRPRKNNEGQFLEHITYDN